jgi:hypothetical protein
MRHERMCGFGLVDDGRDRNTHTHTQGIQVVGSTKIKGT